MSIFHNYRNPQCTEGHTPSSFTYDPSIISLREMILYELKRISYYIVKLDDMSIDISDAIDEVILHTAITIINADFKREKYLKTIERYKEIIDKLEQLYMEECKKHGYSFQPLKSPENSENDLDISMTIHKGEKQNLFKNVGMSKTKRTLYEIIEHLVKDASLHLAEIHNYGYDYADAKKSVIRLFSNVNFLNSPDEKWKSKIESFIETNFSIANKLQEIISEKYGPIEEKSVDLTIKQGNAILVSGHFYKDLELLLKATEGKDINVYTHNDMLLAHTYKELNKYPHLVGHYQRSINNLQLDFATFPGAVLITRNTQPQIDIIRGRIFTLSDYPAFGIAKIDSDNFEVLINAAKETSGFNEDISVGKINVGYNKEKVLEKLHTIIDKIKSGEIRHLFIVGMTNQSPAQNFYFEDFFDVCPDDCYIISLAYNKNKHNIWHIDSYYDFSLIYLLIDELRKEFDLKTMNMTMFLTQWNLHTISHIFNLRHKDVQNIYLGDICSHNLNPILTEGLNEIYNIKSISINPGEDIEKILKEHETT